MLITRPSLRSLLFLLQYLLYYCYAGSYELFDNSGETWVTIGGDPSALLANAARDRYGGASSRELRSCPESKREPSWTGDGKDFLAYGVDLRKVRTQTGPVAESWVHSSFDDGEEFLDPNDHSRIQPALLAKIKRELRLARDLVGFLDRRGGSNHNVVNRIYSGEELSFAEGVEDIRLELYRAREVMDERLAAINFALCRAEPDVENYVRQVYGAYIQKWHLLSDMRGICVDFRSFNPDTTLVSDCLRRQVPLYYPVDPEYCPNLSGAEARLVEAVKTYEDFVFALHEASVFPKIRKSETAPLKYYGVAIDPDAPTRPWRAPRFERFDDLDSHAKVVLTDILHTNLAPLVLPFEGSPSLTIVGGAVLIVDSLTELRMMCWQLMAQV